MKRLLYLVLALVLITPTFGILAQEDTVLARMEEYSAAFPRGYGVISIDDLNVWMMEKPVVLLDVREVNEYEAGHIPESFNVPIRTLAQNLNLLPDLDAEIAVICKGGGRAMVAMTALHLLGYANARTLRGGFDAWAGDDMPVSMEGYTREAGVAPDFDPVLLAEVDAALSGLPQGFGFVPPANLSVELAEREIVLIDVRSQDEWNSNGYIEGAQHIWINEFVARRDELPENRDAEIVVYCAGGWRGSIAMVFMKLMGYTNVRNLAGGMYAWNAAGLPVEGGAAAVPAFDLAAHIASVVAVMPATFNAVRIPDLAAELESGADLLLVDVRTADEYAEGFIEGAINIPMNEIMGRLDMLPDLNQNIVIYCGSGHRSALVMFALDMLGYTNVRSMLSGTNAWVRAELPLTQAAVEYTPGTAPAVDPAVLEAVSAYVNAIPAGYYAVRAADLNVELLENAPVLIDVRTDGEWAQGRIEGAIHIPLADFMNRRAEWPQDLTTAIVVYDNPTHRSSIAMSIMRMLGYENVRVLGGGTGAWTAAELPLVTD
jgi:rhodanese-related sulfurtransferase